MDLFYLFFVGSALFIGYVRSSLFFLFFHRLLIHDHFIVSNPLLKQFLSFLSPLFLPVAQLMSLDPMKILNKACPAMDLQKKKEYLNNKFYSLFPSYIVILLVFFVWFSLTYFILSRSFLLTLSHIFISEITVNYLINIPLKSTLYGFIRYFRKDLELSEIKGDIPLFNPNLLASILIPDAAIHNHAIAFDKPCFAHAWYEVDILYGLIKLFEIFGLIKMSNLNVAERKIPRSIFCVRSNKNCLYTGIVSHTRKTEDSIMHTLKYSFYQTHLEIMDCQNCFYCNNHFPNSNNTKEKNKVNDNNDKGSYNPELEESLCMNHSFDDMFSFTSNNLNGLSLFRKFVMARFNPSKFLSFKEIIETIKNSPNGHLVNLDPSKKEKLKIFFVGSVSVLGININPVHYYYIYKFDSTNLSNEQVASLPLESMELVSCVALVENTPWGRKISYVLNPQLVTPSNNNDCDILYKATIKKEMHVSPFMHMNYRYIANFNKPSKQLNFHWKLIKTNPDDNINPNELNSINDEELKEAKEVSGPSPNSISGEGEKEKEVSELNKKGLVPEFYASMRLNFVSLSEENLFKTFLFFPFQPFKVYFGIYWNAAILFLWKKAKYYAYPYDKESKAVFQ